MDKGRGDAGLHRNRRKRPTATAVMRARERAAWGLSGSGIWGKRERREWAIRCAWWCGRYHSWWCGLKREGRRGPAGELLGRLRTLLTFGPHTSVTKRRGGGVGLAAGPRLGRFTGSATVWPGWAFFFLTNLFLISVFPKQKQNHPKTFQKKIDKILFEKLVKYRTLWHLACQQNKIIDFSIKGYLTLLGQNNCFTPKIEFKSQIK